MLSIVALAWPMANSLMLIPLGWWLCWSGLRRMASGKSPLMRLLQPQRKD